MTTKFRPLQDRILVRPFKAEEKTKGGIIIPDTAKEKPLEGEVIAAGDGKILQSGQKQPLEVKTGDRVIFTRYSGTEIKLDDEEYKILREEEILGVITS